ncbi:sugar porter family MFS transporter [Agriterribacter sp.]|uniref:sugar porter family MFS transporter n=1 Tax=Agriterribacter sp. TaxID=2821509 RepID=UPI002B6D7C7A|nr:sugar porter family MFS transporter [Agriterribacter sp.]HTN06193.1 sugar porter family MFS transporter [Agriterribacter sp.]
MTRRKKTVLQIVEASPPSEGNTKYVYFVSIVAAVGGLLFGYDTAVIAGAIGFLQTKFELSPAMTGWAASSAIWGCVFGAVFAGHLSDRFGRKKILLLTAVLFAGSSIASALPENLTQFVLARFIGGLGVGAASILSPLYISEISPARIRGTLVTLYQVAIVVGINLIYIINYFIAGMGDETWNVNTGWRYMMGSEVVPSAIFFFLLLVVPESPRWLAKKGKEKSAAGILNKINGETRGTEILREINETLHEEKGTFAELFKPGLKKAMIIGMMLAVFSQITGINSIIYYAPEIFKSAGFGTESAFLQTVIIGLIITLFTFVAVVLIDRVGRRKLLLWGVSGMAVSLLSIGLVYHFEWTIGPWLLISILGFIACFGASLGPIPWVIMSEIFPNKTRGLAMSVSVLLLWLSIVAITQFFPMLMEAIGGAYTYWLFMGNAILLLIFIWKELPETKGKSLEAIEKNWKKQHLV